MLGKITGRCEHAHNTHYHLSVLIDSLVQVTYFGGPEVNPGSSNMSSLEREEDFEFTGVSCSITCISDITECDTTLKREEIKIGGGGVFILISFA